MKKRDRIEMIVLASGLVDLLVIILAVQGRWWSRLTERPPGPTQAFVCSNPRCGIRFQAEVIPGRENRCPECKWLAKPAEPESSRPK